MILVPVVDKRRNVPDILFIERFALIDKIEQSVHRSDGKRNIFSLAAYLHLGSTAHDRNRILLFYVLYILVKAAEEAHSLLHTLEINYLFKQPINSAFR